MRSPYVRTYIGTFKIIFLSFLLFVCFSIAFFLTGLSANGAIDSLMLLCLLDTTVFSFFVVYARFSGPKLILTTFFIFFVSTTLVSQTDALLQINENANVNIIPQLLTMSCITAALYSPLAVIIHWRVRGSQSQIIRRVSMPLTEWFWKIALLMSIYLIEHVVFLNAIFLQLGGEAVGGITEVAILSQALKAVLWIIIGVSVITVMNGQIREIGLAVALIISVPVTVNLLVPSGILPLAHFTDYEAARGAYLSVLFASNFLFGWLIVLILNIKRRI